MVDQDAVSTEKQAELSITIGLRFVLSPFGHSSASRTYFSIWLQLFMSGSPLYRRSNTKVPNVRTVFNFYLIQFRPYLEE